MLCLGLVGCKISVRCNLRYDGHASSLPDLRIRQAVRCAIKPGCHWAKPVAGPFRHPPPGGRFPPPPLSKDRQVSSYWWPFARKHAHSDWRALASGSAVSTCIRQQIKLSVQSSQDANCTKTPDAGTRLSAV